MYRVEEKQLHKEHKLMILLVIPIVFILYAILSSIFHNRYNFEGFIRIITSPTILVTDFMEVGGVEAAFINAAIIALVNIYILKYYKLRINGLLIAEFMTVVGFSFFGKNIFNVIPIYLGGYLFSKYQKIDFRDSILVVMFGTALAPIVSEISFSDIIPYGYRLLVGCSTGVFIGFIIVPLSSHMLRFHDGYNLYNIGFTSGIIGTILTSIFRSFNVDIDPVNIIYDQNNWSIIVVLLLIFLYLISIGVFINKRAIIQYRNIFRYRGRLITDFTHLIGYGVTFVNMGIMGILSVVYVIIIRGSINGAIMAAILTVTGFSAFGKHLKNCIPIVIGVILAAVILNYDLSTTGIVITVLFSTTLAPLAGSYGLIIGIIAGMLHLIIVTNVGVMHGGINLYNNGFAGGIVSGFMIPIIDAFKKGRR